MGPSVPLARVSDPLGGADALPFPSSPGGITAADLVKPRAKRPRAAAGRWRSGAGALRAVPAPAAPRPLLGLLGVESPGDPACTGRLPAAVGRRCAEGWLKSPCPPPPLPCGAAGWLPSRASKNCGNNTCCCSEKGVAFAGGGGGFINNLENQLHLQQRNLWGS